MSTLAEVTAALEALACPGDPVRLGAGSLHLYCATSSGRCPEKAAAGSPVHRLTLRYAGYAREWTVYPAQVYTRSKSRWYAERIYRLTPECVARAAPMIEGVDTGVTMAAEDNTDHAVVDLDRSTTVAAALHMIACALGEVAALDAERAIAPHMKVSKP